MTAIAAYPVQSPPIAICHATAATTPMAARPKAQAEASWLTC